MHSEAAAAFDLEQETEKVRDAYGRGRFGQGCLLARRLVERGVPFVEVTLGSIDGNSPGWDTHQNNFPAVRNLSGELDAAWSALVAELQDRGLLESTTILWMGEFGRTPTINNNAGRDHFPAAWSAVLAGGGIRGGMAHGRTSDDGMTVADSPAQRGRPGRHAGGRTRHRSPDAKHQRAGTAHQDFRRDANSRGARLEAISILGRRVGKSPARAPTRGIRLQAQCARSH